MPSGLASARGLVREALVRPRYLLESRRHSSCYRRWSSPRGLVASSSRRLRLESLGAVIFQHEFWSRGELVDQLLSGVALVA